MNNVIAFLAGWSIGCFAAALIFGSALFAILGVILLVVSVVISD